MKTRTRSQSFAYNHIPAEVGGGPYLVETAGYIPKQKQLEIIMSSGAKLDEYNRKRFPNLHSGDDEPVYDPTTDKGYDVFDYHADVSYLRNKITERRHREWLESQGKLEPSSLPLNEQVTENVVSGAEFYETPPKAASASKSG